MSTRTFKGARSGLGLYYLRICNFLTTIGEYNQVCGVYDKLDTFMPKEVEYVFNRYYSRSRKKVIAKHDELLSRYERQWTEIMRSCKELGIPVVDEDVREFRLLAQGSQSETKFREKIRGKVGRLYENAEQYYAGETEKLNGRMSLRDLITWFQGRPKRK